MRTDRLTGGTAPRYLAILVAAVLGLSLFPATAFAAHNPDNVDPCENAPVANEYVDRNDARNVHEPSIDCVIYLSIAVGSTNSDGDSVYNPLREVTRGQMASFIAQTLDAGGYDSELSDGQTDRFNDIAGNVHKRNINRLADAEIVAGTGGGAYSPNASVTRQQMASFIVQAAEFAVGDEHPIERDATDRFVDVSASNVHKSNIEAGADATPVLFRGVTATTFEPGANVLRDQMATFLVNLVRYIFSPGRIVTLTVTDNSVAAGQPVTGSITNATGATVTGCGITSPQTLSDTSPSTAGFQFSVNIPGSQAPGSCTLTFNVTRSDGETVSRTAQITVEGTSGASATTRPELSSAVIVDTVTAAETAAGGGPTGTTVRYTFDEEITGPAPRAGAFWVYNAAGTPNTPGAGTPVVVQVDPSGNSVVVRFTDIATDAAAANLTVATVDFNAVTDNESQVNPIGDAALNSASTTLTAGTTAAPDLVRIENFRNDATTPANTLVDFIFDEAAFTVVTGGFHVLQLNGNDIQCNAVGGQPGGQPGAGETADTSITVTCPQPGGPGGADLVSGDVARAYVDQGTVGDAAGGGNVNPLQAADNTGGGNTTDPDLETASFFPNGSNPDQVVFDFDEAVAAFGGGAFDPTRFFAYNASGAQTVGIAPAPTTGASADQVVVTFPNGTLDQAVGASVEDNAVTGTTGGAGRSNEEDEVGVTPLAQTATGSGRTEDPDLTGVAVTTETTAGGTRAVVTYTFDEDVVTATGAPPGGPNFALFFIVQGDGTVYRCANAGALSTGSTEDTDNTVSCNSFVRATGEPPVVPGAPETATNQQVTNAVLGLVDNGAVVAEGQGGAPGTNSNPEGAELISGTTGSRQA